MRKPCIAVLLFLSATLAFTAEPETIAQLKRRAEAAKPANQPRLFLQVAERQQVTAAEAYRNGSVEEGRAAVEEVAIYSEKAGAAATASRKHRKETEITVRDMVRKLDSLRETLSFDDRLPVQAAIERLQKVCDSLLQTLFGP